MMKFFRGLKRIPRVLCQRDFFLLPQPVSEIRGLKRLGSPYGGWVCQTAELRSESVAYSFGVGTDISFDLELVALTGCTLHAFDPTPDSASWIRQQGLPANLHFHGFGLADRDGELIFRRPDIPGYFSPSAAFGYPGAGERFPVHRLATIMKKLGHSSIDLLKMDIEGSEYAVIENMCAEAIFPRQLLVEFHHRMAGIGIGKTKASLNQLRQAGYWLASVSPRGEEFTFVRPESG